MKSDLSAEAVLRWKAELRHEAQRRLRAFSAVERNSRSQQLVELAGSLPEIRTAACCAYFIPLPFEPAIRPLLELGWARSQRVALPRRAREGGGPQLHWYEVNRWQQLSRLPQERLLEPDPKLCPPIEVRELDCVLVPGLAFDLRGNRLGRGGGYYDAALAEFRAPTETIGLMFAAQRQPILPCCPHDRPLCAVLTEAGLTRFGPRHRLVT